MVDTPEVKVRDNDDTTTIWAKGFLDLSNDREFAEALRSAADSGKGVVLDMRDVTYIDTAIISHLAVASKKLLARDARLKAIVKNDTQPQYVLRVVGLNTIMDLVESED